ncbi:hypothetical protein FCM35_KLT01711 [Carex littledalei]|uniref:Uncharacterized protein n=1 Tax=Carex littledalei TaxID=544730 RepID=A0A833VN78_9POAL|nr:hypothetical protein FCM35_KLT01711 [Carex littledalei]
MSGLGNDHTLRNGEEKDGDREESPGVEHGEGDFSGLIVDEFNAREAVSSCMLYGGIKQFSLLSRSSRNQEGSNQARGGGLIQISTEHIIGNEEKTDLWH